MVRGHDDAFVAEDRLHPLRQGGVLFIGSSIFPQWTNVAEHMAPLPAFNRAFGGSRTWEILHDMDRVVLPYRPKFIVHYAHTLALQVGDDLHRTLEG